MQKTLAACEAAHQNKATTENNFLEAGLYDQWKRYGHHLEEYASEFVGTAFFMFWVVGAVAFMFAHSSPVVPIIPSPQLRLFFTGLMIGSSGWLVALSPPGRLSGAHLNPAVSIGFWLLRKMHAVDLLGYCAAQMLGALAGAAGASLMFGQLSHEVKTALLTPAAGVSGGWLLLAEAATTFLLAFVLYTFVSNKKLLRWTPAAVTLSAGILVCADGSFSGAGMNPARWLGPAFQTGDWQFGWVYVVGPIAGAVLAALLRRTGAFYPSVPQTGKVFHDGKYRSVFRNDKAPTKPPAVLRQSSLE